MYGIPQTIGKIISFVIFSISDFNPEGENQLKELRAEGRIKETGCGVRSWSLKQASAAGSCEGNDEPKSCLKYGKFLD